MRRLEAASRVRGATVSVARREGGVGGGSRETFPTVRPFLVVVVVRSSLVSFGARSC